MSSIYIPLQACKHCDAPHILISLEGSMIFETSLLVAVEPTPGVVSTIDGLYKTRVRLTSDLGGLVP